MVNEEKVILMTKMTSHETGEGRKNLVIGNYFRSDYIGIQVLKSIISATIATMIVFGVYIFYNFETFMEDIYKTDLLAYGKHLLTIFLIAICLYTVISYLVYAYRYRRAKRSLKTYYNNLKKLSNMYEK